MWLLTASYFFYGFWNWHYLILIVLSTSIDYLAARWIFETGNQRKRKLLLLSSIACNLGILFLFKYFNFFIDSVQDFANLMGIHIPEIYLTVLLPVGISFYTLQSMSYTIDVYRGKSEPERHFGIFALFVAFWPQLVAGPIEKAHHLLPQLKKLSGFNYDNVKTGLILIAGGLFKKIVIADRLGVFVVNVYQNHEAASGLAVTLAALFFAFQVYLDFSAYSEIAIGCARVMGVKLTTNFRRPFLATSVSDFWSRWHITLITWFKDYIYIPLGGSHRGRFRHIMNVMIVFLISGFWHGAAWHYIIWGGLCGAYLLLLNPFFVKRKYNLVSQVLAGLVIYLVFSLVLIVFRASSIQQAIEMIGKLSLSSEGDIYNHGLGYIEFWMAVCLVSGLYCMEVVQEKKDLLQSFLRRPFILRWAVYISLVLGIIYLGVYGEGAEDNAFIYFQF